MSEPDRFYTEAERIFQTVSDGLGYPPEPASPTEEHYLRAYAAAIRAAYSLGAADEREETRREIHRLLLDETRMSKRARTLASSIVWNVVGLRARGAK